MFEFSLPDFAFAFLSIVLEGLPFVLLGTILSGLIDAFLPSRVMSRLLPRHPALAIFLSGGLGFVFPMCECGIVPVIRRLMCKGLPVGCGLAYMLSAPIVNPVVALSTYAAFRGQDAGIVTGFRLGLGYIVAVTVTLLAMNVAFRHILRPTVLKEIESDQESQAEATSCHHAHHHGQGCCAQTYEEAGHDCEHDVAQSHSHEHWVKNGKPLLNKLSQVVQVTSADFLDVSMFLVIGAALAAIFNTAIDQEVIIPLAFNTPLAIAIIDGTLRHSFFMQHIGRLYRGDIRSIPDFC